jgi:hypothetical protein
MSKIFANSNLSASLYTCDRSADLSVLCPFWSLVPDNLVSGIGAMTEWGYIAKIVVDRHHLVCRTEFLKPKSYRNAGYHSKLSSR